MSEHIAIEILDFDGFKTLADDLEDVRVIDAGFAPDASQAERQKASEARCRLFSDFVFLESLRRPINGLVINQCHVADAYVCAVRVNGDDKILVGVSNVKYFDSSNLFQPTVDYMDKLGNNSLKYDGYDCITAMSVHVDNQKQGISAVMIDACADVMVARHEDRGGKGPALIHVSSFSPEGRERLLPAFKRLAARREDIVVSLNGTIERRELGDWIAKLPATRASAGKARRPVCFPGM